MCADDKATQAESNRAKSERGGGNPGAKYGLLASLFRRARVRISWDSSLAGGPDVYCLGEFWEVLLTVEVAFELDF